MSTLAQQRLGLGGTPALLVIDATLGFTDPNSPCGARMDSEVAQIARLISMFHELGLPVVFTVNAYVSPQEASVFRQKLPALDALQLGSPWAELDPRLPLGKADTVVRKTVPSAFWGTGLQGLLAARGIDSVVICGFSTSGCVRASAVDALQADLRVWVAADACGDRDHDAHHYNLRDLALKTGEVVNTDGILAHMADRLKGTSRT